MSLSQLAALFRMIDAFGKFDDEIDRINGVPVFSDCVAPFEGQWQVIRQYQSSNLNDTRLTSPLWITVSDESITFKDANQSNTHDGCQWCIDSHPDYSGHRLNIAFGQSTMSYYFDAAYAAPSAHLHVMYSKVSGTPYDVIWECTSVDRSLENRLHPLSEQLRSIYLQVSYQYLGTMQAWVAAVLGKAAAVDGVVNDREVAATEEFILTCPPRLQQAVREAFLVASSDAILPGHLIALLRAIPIDNGAQFNSELNALLHYVLSADGPINSSEHAFLSLL